MSENTDLHYSSESCYACRHSIGVCLSMLPGGESSHDTEVLLWCRKLDNFTLTGWDCHWYEREPGADYPSEMREAVTAAFIAPWAVERSKKREEEARARSEQREDRNVRNA